MQNDVIGRFKPQQEEQWKKELEEKGVVVLENVLGQEEVDKAVGMFWDWLEALGTGIQRNNFETWKEGHWPGMKHMGFFSSYGGCHTRASWYLRLHPGVRRAFSAIWNTDKLITSFDTFIGWKPWWLKPEWKPSVENLHVDQNPFFKKGFQCVQGMIPLKRVRKDEVGGLMVVPGSNNEEVQQYLIKRYPNVGLFPSDWVELLGKDPYLKKGVLVECEAGDLILWDSRTIHGGFICEPSADFKEKNTNDFVRLAMTVTMLPRESASEEVLQLRKVAFMNKKAHTHWANETNSNQMGGFLPGVSTDLIKYQWNEFSEVEELV